MASNQSAIVRELLKRRESLDPQKRAVVDELAKRFNISADVKEFGPSSRQNFGTDPNAVDYQAAEASQNKPSMLTDPKGWWKSLSDVEKQTVLDNIGEFAGGTAGAIAGEGLASIPGAGAGARTLLVSQGRLLA